MHKLLESKENNFAAILNIEPVSCEKVELRRRQPEIKLTPDLAPEFHYPLYPLGSNEIISSHTTPQKKMFFLQNDEGQTTPTTPTLTSYSNLSDDVKRVITKAPSTSIYVDNTTDIPAVKKVPDYMNIPNLWNVQVVHPEPEKKPQSKDEKEESLPESSSSSSDWELV